jgi:thiamine pyrophosphokinase
MKIMHVTIFANGDISQTHIDLPQNTTIFAADGGARHCLALGIKPDMIIGDFDSLTYDEIASLKAQGVEFSHFPTDKDETDLELALNHALNLGANQVTLYGLLGGRWDMSLANLMLLGSPQYTEISFRVFSSNTEAYILRSGETLELLGKPGDIVSVIPLANAINGLTYNGLQWPLEDATLPFSSPRGVSNTLVSTKARIQLELGLMLVFLIHNR